MSNPTEQLGIAFPCLWGYTIIGNNREQVQTAVFESVPREYALCDSNRSKTGKYQSFNLRIEVKTREEMLEIFEKLKHHSCIKMVI
jgi:uncharacterized protein